MHNDPPEALILNLQDLQQNLSHGKDSVDNVELHDTQYNIVRNHVCG